MLSGMKKPIAIAVVLLLLAFALGFRVGHPHSGLKNALGSAQSGIVHYKKADSFKVGSKIVANLKDESASPILAIVRASSPKVLDIQGELTSQQIKTSDALGKLILVVPFIGTIIGVVGL